ncbi:MAG: TA system VapC family ribonuclease toxin [Terracidiphilus sp.]
MTRNYLLDLNVLIALVDSGHQHYQKAQDWFISSGKDHVGLCPLTEAGFLRITTNPAYRPAPRTIEEAIAILQVLKGHPRFGFWEIKESWVDLTARFALRISGHRQVTDAYLLGLAIKAGGVLVTFDKSILYMAGAEFSQNVLVIE